MERRKLIVGLIAFLTFAGLAYGVNCSESWAGKIFLLVVMVLQMAQYVKLLGRNWDKDI